MESQYFIFDGIQSQEMGLQIMRIDHSGFIEVPYISGANIHESTSRKRIKPYFYGVTREILEFTVQFVLVDRYGNPKEWTPQERYRIGKWLFHNEYKEFISSDDLGKRYYCIAISDTDLNLINSQGYIEVKFRCNSPYAFSPVYVNKYDLSSNNTTQTIILENMSNVVKFYNPLIQVELVNGATSFQLKNLSNGGKIMKFESLLPNEIISIDCQNRIIKSNIPESNPFAKFNIGMKRYWMDLVYGQNLIQVEGTCIIKTKMEYPIV